ncbi:MAG: GNAT family N-acetyltransferase [Ardenticatenia bacterium]|nr:GNAT family N-acetyltransferase [Ardenticatenia bacterium]
MATLRRLVWSERLDPTQLRWSQFWVVQHRERIIACGQLRHFPGVRELGSLVVVPEWRGRGIGSALVRHLVAQADAPVFLECAVRLVEFYERLGFRQVSWKELPWPLKIKFGVTLVVGTLVRRRAAFMGYDDHLRKGGVT